ncbi:hypothetical protein [Phaffia rhodozyma]|uniref:Uncharacterized protein n=1 Tax=Phaffia rhodozyma TaxID=264483 RepID=A0A0F7SL30_PHARH|nr:hypothetical protein [Phaffia rhodozyma]
MSDYPPPHQNYPRHHTAGAGGANSSLNTSQTYRAASGPTGNSQYTSVAFKPMYDLPSFHHPNSAGVPSSPSFSPIVNPTKSDAGSNSRGTAGGLNRTLSPPAAGSRTAGGLKSTVGGRVPGLGQKQGTGNGRSTPAATTSPLIHQPQARPARHAPVLSIDPSCSNFHQLSHPSPSSPSFPSPLPLRSPTPGSTSVFSKAPQNPSSPSPADLNLFSEHCRRLFYEGDPRSQAYIDHVLSTLPPSHRAAFTRTQASIRSAFHADESLRRRNEFEVIVRVTEPGGGLTIQARRDLDGAIAKRERLNRLKAFIKTHAGKNDVGPKPFFVALYTLLGFQDIPRIKPRRRSEPRLSRPSMTHPSLSSSPFRRDSDHDAPFSTSPNHTRLGKRGKAPPPPSQTNNNNRRRASSDPFSDPHAQAKKQQLLQQQQQQQQLQQQQQQMSRSSMSNPSHGLGFSSRRGPAPPVPIRPHPSILEANNAGDRSRSNASSADCKEPITPGVEDPLLLSGNRPSNQSVTEFSEAGVALLDEEYDNYRHDEDDDEDGFESDTFEGELDAGSLRPRWRTWISPENLSDPELKSLIRAFPSHITKSASKTARFPYVGPPKTGSDPIRSVEEGRGLDGMTMGKGVLEGVGTGRMWKGEEQRGERWRGSWWQRVKCWFGGLFG